MLFLAHAFFLEHGNLNLPPDYKADGIWPAKWLKEQRQIYNGNRPGKQLSEDQIPRLNAIGMEWGNRAKQRQQSAWDVQYAEARRFYEQYGHLNIPTDDCSASSKKLRRWLKRQRSECGRQKLSDTQKKQLEAIGFQWSTDSWEAGFDHARQYFLEHGRLDAPPDYVCEDGYKLGSWLSNQRTNLKKTDTYRHLSKEKKARLDTIGMVWNYKQAAWDEGYKHAEENRFTL